MPVETSTRRRPPALQRVQAPRLSQAVFDQLVRQLDAGDLRPGDRLPSELELMRMTGVGRSSVREAIRGLAAVGLVAAHPGRGTHVLPAGRDPVLAGHSPAGTLNRLRAFALIDLLEVRESIEGRAAELAALRATEADLAAIRDAAGAVAADIAAGKTYFESNRRFHAAIARASHNPVMLAAIENLLGQVRQSRELLMRRYRDMPRRDLAEHAAIVKAITARNPARARDAVLSHLRSFAALIEKEVTHLPPNTG